MFTAIKYSNVLFFRGSGVLYTISIGFVFLLGILGVIFLTLTKLETFVPFFCIIISMMFDLIRLQKSDFLDVHYFIQLPLTPMQRSLTWLMSEMFNLKSATCVVMIALCFCLSGSSQSFLIAWISVVFMLIYLIIGSVLILLARRSRTANRMISILLNVISLFTFFQLFRLFLDAQSGQSETSALIIKLSEWLLANLNELTIYSLMVAAFLFPLHHLTTTYIIKRMPFQNHSV